MRKENGLLAAALILTGAFLGCAEGTSSGTQTTTTTTGNPGGQGGQGGGQGGEGGSGGSQGGSAGSGGSMGMCGDGALDAGEACDDGNTNPGDGCDAACAEEPGFTCLGEPSDCFTKCGDGEIGGAETCDDGNSEPGDGCDAQCLVETGYVCDGMPSACATECGDGTIAGTEQCDDGNMAPQDGCDAACQVEPGFVCIAMPSICDPQCGDGLIAGMETCDDGNILTGDGCNAACKVEVGFVCVGAPSACDPVCGDGLIVGAETCDDLNQINDDGCSSLCFAEPGYVCLGQPSICSTICGDGAIAGPEACDDGATLNGDGCSATCALETGWACTGSPSACDTVCGDQIIVPLHEACDDGDSASGNGCSATCQIENGFYCSGAPSICTTQCGDSIVAGAETCDDSAKVNGDGCSASCLIELGYYCSGMPSACVTQCGDGIKAGTELCDDGNQVSGDGCSAQCIPNTGDTCPEALVMSQAVQMGGKTTWTVAQGAVTASDGTYGCDPNGVGPDVIAKYTKTTGKLASGGKLLHVKADTPTQTSTTYYLDLEVKGGACAVGMGTSVKCNWFKDNWDAYLDVPAGDYWIFVAKNGSGTPFPDVTIMAEEIDPPAAQGEGCFAPYTAMSANYTAPAGAGLPHTWTIADGAINSFDMGATWGEPGSISCDNTAPYGDIHGVDSVIEYNKQSPTSVLKIDVQNNDPVLTQSDLNLEVLNVCDPTSPTKVSRNCRANKDTISITAPSPAGPVYLWVSSEATGEEFNGATVGVTEIFPGPGESWPTAVPIAGSGPISPTSTQRLDAPSCFPAGVNIHWYSYTLTNDVLSISANGAGIVGIYDAGGQELRCVADAQTNPIGILGTTGDTYYIAVQSPGVVTALTLQDVAYNGIQGDATNMSVSFASAPGTSYTMAVSPTQIVLGNLSSVWAFPKTVGAVATQYGSAQGITTTHLGYDMTFVGGTLFSADSITTTTASRVFRIFDGTVWGPGTPWDLTPTYPTSAPTHSLTTDGTFILEATRKISANTDVSFYSLLPGAASTPTLLGTTPGLWYVTGFAADATYFYVASNGTAGEGVYRIVRSNIAAAPLKIATIDTGTTVNNMDVDSLAAAQHLYVRDINGDVHVVVNPAGPSPIHGGVISTLGVSTDFAMAFDHSGGALYLWETETVSTGRVVKLQ